VLANLEPITQQRDPVLADPRAVMARHHAQHCRVGKRYYPDETRLVAVNFADDPNLRPGKRWPLARHRAGPFFRERATKSA
jgi:hypothetical protein